MQEFIKLLDKRRKTAIYVVVLLFFVALGVNYNFEISVSSYFNPEYNMTFVYVLIVYKIIELPILYYLLFHRYILKLQSSLEILTYIDKLKKHTKLLFFLIPQGNTIFGMIAYKLSGDVTYFFIFSFIAFITLLLVKPQSLKRV